MELTATCLPAPRSYLARSYLHNLYLVIFHPRAHALVPIPSSLFGATIVTEVRALPLPRSIANPKQVISEKKCAEARLRAGGRSSKKKYKMPESQRPDGAVAGSTKMIASRFYQIKTEQPHPTLPDPLWRGSPAPLGRTSRPPVGPGCSTGPSTSQSPPTSQSPFALPRRVFIAGVSTPDTAERGAPESGSDTGANNTTVWPRGQILRPIKVLPSQAVADTSCGSATRQYKAVKLGRSTSR